MQSERERRAFCDNEKKIFTAKKWGKGENEDVVCGWKTRKKNANYQRHGDDVTIRLFMIILHSFQPFLCARFARLKAHQEDAPLPPRCNLIFLCALPSPSPLPALFVSICDDVSRRSPHIFTLFKLERIIKAKV